MPKSLIKQLIGLGVGLVIGVMILLLGFFRTLLLVVLGGLGWWLCGSRELPQSLVDMIDRIRSSRQ